MAVLSLGEAKNHLNITTSDFDAELESVVAAAEARLAHDCGPLEPTTYTVRVDGRCAALVLPTTPAVSLTSVTPAGGTALTVGDLYLDGEAGMVTYSTGGGYFGDSAYTVVYEAGRSSVDEDLLMAVKELVRLAWSPQRGGSRRPGSAPQEGYSNTLPGVGEELPFAVQKWLRGHVQPGFA